MPSDTVIASHKALETLRVNGRICEGVTAKKGFKCRWSGLPILPGEEYYQITLAGSGIASIKFPDRVKAEYIDEYLSKNIKKKEENNGTAQQ